VLVSPFYDAFSPLGRSPLSVVISFTSSWLSLRWTYCRWNCSWFQWNFIYPFFCVHVTVHRNKFLFNKTYRRTNFPNLCRQETLHVSGSSSAHYQEFPLYIRHWYMTCRFDESFQARRRAWKLSSNLHDIYQCRMYGWKGTVRNM